MGPTVHRPRRPWLAALLSLLCGPLGQLYAGRLYRSLILWAINAVLWPVLAYTTIFLPIGRFNILVLMICAVGFPIYRVVDAYVVAKRYREEPLARFQRWWVYLLAFVAIVVTNNVAAHGLRSFVFEAFVIPTRGMSPSILAGDRILVDKIWCQPNRLQRNDIVVYQSRGPDSSPYVIRLIGLPGDRIEIANEKVLLNGEEWPDSHAFLDSESQQLPQLTNCGPILVPADSFFALGDNRRRSKDSRIVGPIPFADLLGRARMIYWSRERRFPDPWDTSNYQTGPIGWSRIGMRLD